MHEAPRPDEDQTDLKYAVLDVGLPWPEPRSSPASELHRDLIPEIEERIGQRLAPYRKNRRRGDSRR
ncbi:MAG: hypothetical protein ACP5XB_17785 [Isosphaeraceae bacterium]